MRQTKQSTFISNQKTLDQKSDYCYYKLAPLWAAIHNMLMKPAFVSFFTYSENGNMINIKEKEYVEFF